MTGRDAGPSRRIRRALDSLENAVCDVLDKERQRYQNLADSYGGGEISRSNLWAGISQALVLLKAGAPSDAVVDILERAVCASMGAMTNEEEDAFMGSCKAAHRRDWCDWADRLVQDRKKRRKAAGGSSVTA